MGVRYVIRYMGTHVAVLKIESSHMLTLIKSKIEEKRAETEFKIRKFEIRLLNRPDVP